MFNLHLANKCQSHHSSDFRLCNVPKHCVTSISFLLKTLLTLSVLSSWSVSPENVSFIVWHQCRIFSLLLLHSPMQFSILYFRSSLQWRHKKVITCKITVCSITSTLLALCGESTDYCWIPAKGPAMRKRFHSMTSSCFKATGWLVTMYTHIACIRQSLAIPLVPCPNHNTDNVRPYARYR